MLDHIALNKQHLSRRTFILGFGSIILLFLLSGRMFYMQFIKKDKYKTLSEKNSIKIILIPPVRGTIFDNNAQVLAQNNTCFRLLLYKGMNNKFLDEVHLITEMLGLTDEQVTIINKKIKQSSKRNTIVVVIDNMSWQQIAVVEEQKADMKSLFIDIGFNRYYPNGMTSAHITGYLGKPSKQIQATMPPIDDDSFRVGKSGIEQYYDASMRGEFGLKRVEVNALGKYVRQLSENKPTTGDDLHLNIDAALQEKAMSYLSPQGGSIVAMSCINGGVIICASSPTFDPNKFNKLSVEYWQELTQNPYKPLINKVTQSLYPPGSIFKIVTAIAALEQGINPSHRVMCRGGAVLGGNRFRCARNTGHGLVNMIEALKYSCNSYMYHVAMQIGADWIINTAKKFGFGELTGIDMPGELKGLVPSAHWKKIRYNQTWTIGDTLNLSIGQGFILSTPIQLARMIAAVASDGKLFTPRIVTGKPQWQQLSVRQEHLAIVKTALYEVVNTPGGTGYFSRLESQTTSMSGKTGTAQVIAKKKCSDDLSRQDIAWSNRNHAIFSGYAPFDDPMYAVSVYFDHGGGGGRAAAPIAKRVMQDILQKYHHG